MWLVRLDESFSMIIRGFRMLKDADDDDYFLILLDFMTFAFGQINLI